MPEVRRKIFFKIGPETLVKHLEQILLKYSVRIKEFSKYYIRGEHGSYSASTPSNCKKEIYVGLTELRDGTMFELAVDYTKAIVVELIGVILVIIIGLCLYRATTEALEYLELYKQGSLLILFEKPPYLLDLLMRFASDIGIEDIELIEFTLKILYFLSVALIIPLITGLVYIAYIPYSAGRFADNIITELQRVVSNIGATGSIEVKSEKTSKEDEKPAKPRQPSTVYCIKSSDPVHIICTVEGTDIDKDSLIKSLITLGFNLYEIYEGVYSGEKSGSYLAMGFLDKKMRVRILFDKNKVKIVFETSEWTHFSDKDCKEAEKTLLSLLG